MNAPPLPTKHALQALIAFLLATTPNHAHPLPLPTSTLNNNPLQHLELISRSAVDLDRRSPRSPNAPPPSRSPLTKRTVGGGRKSTDAHVTSVRRAVVDRYLVGPDGSWNPDAGWELYGVGKLNASPFHWIIQNAVMTDLDSSTASNATTTTTPPTTTTSTSTQTPSILPPGWGGSTKDEFELPLIVACSLALALVILGLMFTLIRRRNKQRKKARSKRHREGQLTTVRPPSVPSSSSSSVYSSKETASGEPRRRKRSAMGMLRGKGLLRKRRSKEKKVAEHESEYEGEGDGLETARVSGDGEPPTTTPEESPTTRLPSSLDQDDLGEGSSSAPATPADRPPDGLQPTPPAYRASHLPRSPPIEPTPLPNPPAPPFSLNADTDTHTAEARRSPNHLATDDKAVLARLATGASAPVDPDEEGGGLESEEGSAPPGWESAPPEQQAEGVLEVGWQLGLPEPPRPWGGKSMEDPYVSVVGVGEGAPSAPESESQGESGEDGPSAPVWYEEQEEEGNGPSAPRLEEEETV